MMILELTVDLTKFKKVEIMWIGLLMGGGFIMSLAGSTDVELRT